MIVTLIRVLIVIIAKHEHLDERLCVNVYIEYVNTLTLPLRNMYQFPSS